MKWDIRSEPIESFPALARILESLDGVKDADKLLAWVVFRYDIGLHEVQGLDSVEQRRDMACKLAGIEEDTDLWRRMMRHDDGPGVELNKDDEASVAAWEEWESWRDIMAETTTMFFAEFNNQEWNLYVSNEVLFLQYTERIRKPIHGLDEDKEMMAFTKKEFVSKAAQDLLERQNIIRTKLTGGDDDAAADISRKSVAMRPEQLKARRR